jgi:hypothetical protein
MITLRFTIRRTTITRFCGVAIGCPPSAGSRPMAIRYASSVATARNPASVSAIIGTALGRPARAGRPFAAAFSLIAAAVVVGGLVLTLLLGAVVVSALVLAAAAATSTSALVVALAAPAHDRGGGRGRGCRRR